MRRLIALLIFLLTALPVWGATLSNHDMLEDYYFGGDSTYIYGVSRAIDTKIVRRSSDGTVSDRANLASYDQVSCVFTSSTENLVWVVAKDASDLHYLLMSVDGGLNFGDNPPGLDDGDYVLKIGLDGAAHTAGCGVLGGSSFCEAEIDGVTTYFIGEYNVNDSRVAGSTNDRVRLMKSTNGYEWSEVITWNNDGAVNNIRHIHAITQDPATGDIYIATGDADADIMILRWDGKTDISGYSNHEPVWYATASGNVSYAVNGLTCGVAHGAQRYRTGYLLFEGSYAYFAADTPADDAERGIWRIEKDLQSVAIRMDSSVTSHAGHSMYSAIETSGGRFIVADYLETTATDKRAYLYISEDAESWECAGTIGLKDASVIGPKNMFEWGGRVYLTCNGFAGGFTGDGGGTVVLDVDSSYLETPEPRILSPVYYMSTGGSDASNGRSLENARLTIADVFDPTDSEQEMCTGAVLKIGAGTYTIDAQVTADWTGSYSNTTGNIVIIGAGKDKTIIYNSGEAVGISFFFNAEETNVDFRDMQIYSVSTSASARIFQNVSGQVLNFYNVRLGHESYLPMGIRLYGEANFYPGCEFLLYPEPGASQYAIWYSGAGSVSTAQGVTFKGGSAQVSFNGAGSTYRDYNCVHVGYKTTGVAFDGTADEIPIIKNSIFYSTVGGAYGLYDLVGLTETDAQIDYNCYYGSLRNIANAGGTHSLTATDPLLVSVTDFHLQATSPCIDAGVNIDGYTTDYAGDSVLEPTDIGAYEYQGHKSTITTGGSQTVTTGGSQTITVN